MKQKNQFDTFIDKLTKEFSQIKNFNLTQEEGNGKILFDFIVKRMAEIIAFKGLFVHYYLPAASKSVVDDLKEIEKSRYRHLILLSKEDLKENYYETIRLGYIGMFHKYENYVDDLLEHFELLISGISDSAVSLRIYVEKVFKYKIKDWQNSPTIKRLNWISICNKHYDGFPRKEPKHHDYLYLPENERMKFNKDDFIEDIELLISHYTSILDLVFAFAIHKITCEAITFETDEFTDTETNEKFKEIITKLTDNVFKMIELNK